MIRVKDVLIYLIIGIMTLVIVLPFLWMLSTAFKPVPETFNWPPTILPTKWMFENFLITWQRGHVPTALLTSAMYAGGVTSLYILITVPAGFGFAKYRFPFRSVLFIIVLSTMMIPIEVIIVPLFMMLSDWRWVGSYQGLIIPRIVHGFGIFLLRQHMQTIPNELIDAARSDGLSEIGILMRIIVPLSKATIGVTALFMFMWKWNELLWPLIIGQSEMKTIQVAIALFIQESYAEWNYLMMMVIIGILPLLLMYIGLQRYFVRGVALSGLKG